MGFADVSS